jgi:hypothetical protein
LCFGVALELADQVSIANDPENLSSLETLRHRATMLAGIADPVQRESHCVAMAALSRALDEELPKNTRIFMSGMLGETNSSTLGYYYFFRNYLFPRDLEISLDGRVTNTVQGFAGVPCDSPQVLTSNGFDLMITVNGGNWKLIPLTKNGVPTPPDSH